MTEIITQFMQNAVASSEPAPTNADLRIAIPHNESALQCASRNIITGIALMWLEMQPPPVHNSANNYPMPTVALTRNTRRLRPNNMRMNATDGLPLTHIVSSSLHAIFNDYTDHLIRRHSLKADQAEQQTLALFRQAIINAQTMHAAPAQYASEITEAKRHAARACPRLAHSCNQPRRHQGQQR